MDQLADFLHLDDEQHPAWQFASDKLEEIRSLGLKAEGCYRFFPVEKLDIREGTVAFPQGVLSPRPQVCGYPNFKGRFACIMGVRYKHDRA